MGPNGKEEYFGIYGVENPQRLEQKKKLVKFNTGDKKQGLDISIFPVEVFEQHLWGLDFGSPD